MLNVGVRTPPGALLLAPWGHVGSEGTFYQRALRLRGGVRRAPRGRAPGKRAGGNEAHLQSIDIKDFKKDIGAGRKLPRDRKRDKELQEWISDDPYNKPTEQRHPLSSSLHPLNRMAALMRMEKMKKRIERRGKGTRRRLAIAKREAMRVQRLRARAATPTALQGVVYYVCSPFFHLFIMSFHFINPFHTVMYALSRRRRAITS